MSALPHAFGNINKMCVIISILVQESSLFRTNSLSLSLSLWGVVTVLLFQNGTVKMEVFSVQLEEHDMGKT